ncbi:MAG: ABC transporter ATP-binding protein [Lachnospiraceae bacterium]|nr:ABC transporter ATP-binding protein [Lachnospiraceae bacterium]
MGEYYFETKDLAVGYDGTVVADKINIGLRKGEILALIGPNGAGKTTALRTMTKQQPPISGQILIGGRDLSKMTEAELSRQMSVVLTDRIQTELMTCRDVVSLGRYPYTGRLGILEKEDNEIVDHCMEITHTTELMNTDFTRISDGQRQRVLLARALCQDPDIILLDEPTSFLDVRYKLEFLTLLRTLARKTPFAVILSLHEIDMAKQVADYILTIKDRTVDKYGLSDEVFSPGYIEHLFDITVGSFNDETCQAIMPPEDPAEAVLPGRTPQAGAEALPGGTEE